MLEFITQNSSFFSVIIVTFSGLFAVVKWVDSRNSELKEKRYKTYMDLISIISGKRNDGGTPNLTEQIAAIWFLLEYREYDEVTKKIFENSDLKEMANEPWVKHVLPHIEKLLAEIK